MNPDKRRNYYEVPSTNYYSFLLPSTNFRTGTLEYSAVFNHFESTSIEIKTNQVQKRSREENKSDENFPKEPRLE